MIAHGRALNPPIGARAKPASASPQPTPPPPPIPQAMPALLAPAPATRPVPVARSPLALPQKRRPTPATRTPAAARAAAASWFVPDISPVGGSCDKAAAAAAWEAVKDMPFAELGLRGIAEAGAAFAVAGLAVSLLARAAAAADAHSDRLEEEEGSVAAAAVAAVGDAPAPPRSSSWAKLAVDAAIGAALRPARVLAPLAAAVQAARTATLVLQIVLRKAAAAAGAKSGGSTGAAAAAAADRVGSLLAVLDGAALDAVQLAAIAGAAWFAVAWKDRVVALALRLAARAQGGAAPPGGALAKGAKPAATNGVDGLERILVPFAGLASWAIVACAAVGCATALGVDVRPLLTVGGVGGLALGFGAQAVTSNAIAGLTLYLTRPFVVGERVTLQTPAGAPVVTGVVERIDPMRTLIRSDRAAPVSIPNKALSDFLVVNESRIRASPLLTGFNDPRQFTMTVDVRHEDLEKVKKMERERESGEGERGWRREDGGGGGGGGENGETGRGNRVGEGGQTAAVPGPSRHALPTLHPEKRAWTGRTPSYSAPPPPPPPPASPLPPPRSRLPPSPTPSKPTWPPTRPSTRPCPMAPP